MLQICNCCFYLIRNEPELEKEQIASISQKMHVEAERLPFELQNPEILYQRIIKAEAA